MSARESLLALAVAVMLLVLVVFMFLLPPIESAFARVNEEADALELSLIEDRAAIANQKAIEDRWQSYRLSGLNLAEDDARIEVQKRLNQWSMDAGVDLPSIMDMRTVPGERFVEVGFVVTAHGDLEGIQKMLFLIRQADLPLRIRKCSIESRRDGDDQLTLSITLSTTVELEIDSTVTASTTTGGTL